MKRPTAKSWGKVGIFAVALCVPAAGTGVAMSLPPGTVLSVQVAQAGASEATLAWTQVAHTRAQPADHTVQYAGLPNIAAAFVRWLVDNLVTGADSGEAVERGSSGGRVDTAKNPRYPNEPPGFVPWFEHDWQSWPNNANERLFASGTGMVRASHYERDAAEDFVLVDDPDAPHGKGKSLRHRQREGQRSGTTSGIFNLFSPKDGAGNSTAYDDQRQLRSVYRSHWVYFEPDPVTADWQFGGYHMRTFWWNRNYGLGHGNVSLRSPPASDTRNLQRSTYWRGVGLWHSTPSTTYWHPTEPLALGVWHHVEVLWETVGEFDVENGIDSRVRIWINGEQVADHSFNHFIERPFANDHFAMVWGGGGAPERVQDDFVRFGDIYISGMPYQPDH